MQNKKTFKVFIFFVFFHLFCALGNHKFSANLIFKTWLNLLLFLFVASFWLRESFSFIIWFYHLFDVFPKHKHKYSTVKSLRKVFLALTVKVNRKIAFHTNILTYINKLLFSNVQISANPYFQGFVVVEMCIFLYYLH